MAGWKDSAEKLILLTGGRYWLFSCAVAQPGAFLSIPWFLCLNKHEHSLKFQFAAKMTQEN